MKSKFEHMIELVVQSLSGEARSFYEREFAFFNEVTSISRKLQPFIKKSKPEKKVSNAVSRNASYFITTCRQKSTKKWKRSNLMSGSTCRVTQMASWSISIGRLDDHCKVTRRYVKYLSSDVVVHLKCCPALGTFHGKIQGAKGEEAITRH